jgi:hypothetical protein
MMKVVRMVVLRLKNEMNVCFGVSAMQQRKESKDVELLRMLYSLTYLVILQYP